MIRTQNYTSKMTLHTCLMGILSSSFRSHFENYAISFNLAIMFASKVFSVQMSLAELLSRLNIKIANNLILFHIVISYTC